MTPARAPAASRRAGQTALLWRLGLLLVLVVAVLLPGPARAGLLFAWGAAALAVLLAAFPTVPPAERGDSSSPPAPLPAGGARGVALEDPPVSPLSSVSLPLVVPSLAAVPLLLAVGLIVYGGVAGLILATGSLVLAGTVAGPLGALSLAVLLPGQNTAAAARSWAVAVGVAGWAALGVVATAELAGRMAGGIPALVPLLLALGAWSAVRRAVRLQGMGGRWPEALGTGVGLTAIVMTTTVGLSQLVLGFVVGLLLAQEADRLLPPARPGLAGLVGAELVAVHQQLVFAAPLVLLALAFFPP